MKKYLPTLPPTQDVLAFYVGLLGSDFRPQSYVPGEDSFQGPDSGDLGQGDAKSIFVDLDDLSEGFFPAVEIDGVSTTPTWIQFLVETFADVCSKMGAKSKAPESVAVIQTTRGLHLVSTTWYDVFTDEFKDAVKARLHLGEAVDKNWLDHEGLKLRAGPKNGFAAPRVLSIFKPSDEVPVDFVQDPDVDLPF